jgi:hypothetical protein
MDDELAPTAAELTGWLAGCPGAGSYMGSKSAIGL